MTFGPVEVLAVGFEGSHFRGEILPELRRLTDQDVIRLIGLLVVMKDLDGRIRSLQSTDLSPDEAKQFVSTLGELLGMDDLATNGGETDLDSMLDAAQLRQVAEAIQLGDTAAVALIEHRWVMPLQQAIARAGGVTLTDVWINAESPLSSGATTLPVSPGPA